MSASARLLVTAALALVAVGASGCGYSFSLNTPEHFVELEDQDPTYALRATSADGVVLAVREVDNEPYGDLGFWTRAVSNELRLAQGYALVETAELRAASGEAGTVLRFGRDDGAAAYVYWVALFADEDHVWVIETGARQELFDVEREAIERALQTFRLD